MMPGRRTPLLAAVIAVGGVAAIAGGLAAQESKSYRQPMLVQSYEFKAALPQPRGFDGKTRSVEPGATRGVAADAVRKLAAEIVVVVKQFRPRAVDPVLLVDGNEAGHLTNVETLPGGAGTRLTFTVPDAAEHLKQGAQIAVQMGNQVETRSNLDASFRSELVTPLDAGVAAQHGLPRNIESK
jgi:hypothetical protein